MLTFGAVRIRRSGRSGAAECRDIKSTVGDVTGAGRRLLATLAALTCTLSAPVSLASDADVMNTVTRVANANYRCAVHAGDGSGRFAEDGFTLKDGKYTGPPSVPGWLEKPEAGLDRDHVAVGDVDGDGKLDAVAPVYDFGEGTGVFWTANVFSDVFGKARCTHAIFLGDRVDLKSIEIQPPDSILIEMMDHGPDEGMAQRTLAVRRKYQVTADNVVAFQQLPGKVWTPYRPEYWAVTKAEAPTAPPTGAQRPSSQSPLGTGEAATAIWSIVTLSAAGDLRGSAIHEMALEVVPKPRRGDRSRARSLNDQGIALLKAERYPEAAASFRSGAAADPGDAEVLNNLAYALLLAEDYPAAAAAIVTTLSTAPSRAMAWETLGQILVGLGQNDAAVGAFKMVVRTASDTAKGEQRLQKVAETVKNPAAVQVIRTALAGGTVAAPVATPTAAAVAAAATRRPAPEVERTSEPRRAPPVTRQQQPESAQEQQESPGGGSNALDPERAVEVINREFGRVCGASLSGWWWKTLKLDWTAETKPIHVNVVLAAITKIKEGLYRGGIRYLQFPNDAGTYNVIDWQTGQTTSNNERAPYYFAASRDERPPPLQDDLGSRSCPPFTNTCSGNTCCPSGTKCCWSQGGGCCPENTDCCVGGGCCPHGTCSMGGCRP